MDILRFVLDAERYAVPLGDVQEITRAAAIARLPEAPEIVEGLLDLRGEIIPVLDVRARFGHDSRPLHPDQFFVIARAGDRTVALRVDAAPAIASADPGKVASPRSITVGTRYVAGVARLPDGLVLIHDLRTFLSAAEAEWMERELVPGARPQSIGS